MRFVSGSAGLRGARLALPGRRDRSDRLRGVVAERRLLLFDGLRHHVAGAERTRRAETTHAVVAVRDRLSFLANPGGPSCLELLKDVRPPLGMEKDNCGSRRAAAEEHHDHAERNSLEGRLESEPRWYAELSQYVGALRRSLSRYTVDPNRLDDFVQESMLEALQSVRAREPPRNPCSWLLKVGHRTAQRAVCRERRHGHAMLVEEKVADGEAQPYDQAVRSEFGELVRDAMYSASSGDRRLLERLYFDGRSCSEIGREFGLSTVNVRQRLFRARAELRRALTRQGVDGVHDQ